MMHTGAQWVALVALVACSRSSPATSDPADALASAATSGQPPAGEPPTIGIDSLPSLDGASIAQPPADAATASTIATMKLLDSGHAPRRMLRYIWNVRQKEQLAVELRTSASTEAGGDKQPEILLPPVHITIAIDPQSVTPQGDLRYRWSVTSASVLSDVQVPSQVAEGMRAEVAAIEHLQGSATVSSRGISTEIAIDPGTPSDAGATGQMIEQVRQTLRDVAAPVPDEEVGRGARWQKSSLLDAKQTRIAQTETFTLLDQVGDKSTLDDVLAQTAPAQVLRAPGMRQGAQAWMESMLASGAAKVRLDLTRLVPQTRFDGTTTMVVSGQSAGENSRRVTMLMRVAIAIQGTLR
jgi:hypothetical protein